MIHRKMNNTFVLSNGMKVKWAISSQVGFALVLRMPAHKDNALLKKNTNPRLLLFVPPTVQITISFVDTQLSPRAHSPQNTVLCHAHVAMCWCIFSKDALSGCGGIDGISWPTTPSCGPCHSPCTCGCLSLL